MALTDLPADFFQNPHPFFAQLRAQGPVHRLQVRKSTHAWLVVGYEAAREALRHPDIRKESHTLTSAAGSKSGRGMNPRLTQHLLNVDGQQHSRLRKLVTPAFAPARIEPLEARVAAIADELFDGLDSASGPVDLLAEYAFPLSVVVICELLGVPAEDRDLIREWSAIAIDSTGLDPEQTRAATDAMVEYFEQLVARRRAEGSGDDLLSALVAANDAGDRLSEDELISMMFLILVAGHETTVNLIGNTVLALLGEPARYRALHGNPAAVPPLIEEMLRYNGPGNISTLRYTAAPVTISDVELPAGDLVLVAVASANHDEQRFPDGERFDPTRTQTGHLGFGHGSHFCIGAGLARMETRIAIARLVERYPGLRLADGAELRWRETLIIRGLHELPVDVAGAAIP